jgi:predicted esterase
MNALKTVSQVLSHGFLEVFPALNRYSLFQRFLFQPPTPNYKENYVAEFVTAYPQTCNIEIQTVPVERSYYLHICDPAKKEEKEKRLIVFLHGNASNIINSQSFLKSMFQHVCQKKEEQNIDWHIIAPEYKGYDPETFGTMYHQNSVVFGCWFTIQHWIRNLCILPEKSLTIIGQSIGTGIASQIATSTRCESLVMISPFSSICNAIDDVTFKVASFLVAERFNTIKTIASKESKQEHTILIHGALDEMIRPQHSKDILVELQKKHFSCEMHLLEDSTHDIMDSKAIFSILSHHFFVPKSSGMDSVLE